MRKTLLRVVAVALLLASNAARGMPTELFFSEYIEGSSNNKALEIFNGTGSSIDLASGSYSVQMFFNGNADAALALTIPLLGTVASGDVYVVAHSMAASAITAQADTITGGGWYNGDDAIVLRKGGVIIDVIGQIGFDPGTEWGSALVSTADNTLRRKSSVLGGDANGADAFDPSVQWEGFATDTFSGLGAHSIQTNGRVPEPGSLALLAIGLLPLAAARRRYLSM